MRRILNWIIVSIFIATLIFFLVPPERKLLYPEFNSFKITDRNGILLRNVLSKDYKTSIWKSIREISPDMIKATIIREDKRFFLHRGVDIIALFRALIQNIKHRRAYSGGSTITMQVAKMILNYRKRNIITKIIEMVYAMKIELHLSKEEILEVYLNRAPYGNQAYGIEAASRIYFEKPASQLSLSEVCILASLPKAPSILNPYKTMKIKEEKEKILKQLLGTGAIDSTRFLLAINEPVQIKEQSLIFRAPHFVDFVLGQIDKGNYSTITSTIDVNLQEKFEKMVSTSVKNLTKFNVHQAAIVVIDTRSGEVIAMVGSKDYFDEKEGQVNGCLALRQPGSSLKPFLYILALSNGIPMSYLINDTITEFKLPDGTLFAPRNYGDKYHGYVRAREALGSSFNIPAVHLLEILGVEKFYNFLNNLHFTSIKKQPSFYGLSLSLGAAEVRLLELTNAYRAIANKGIWSEFEFIKGNKNKPGERVFSEDVAFIITDVLSDNSSRIKAFGDDSPLNLPFPCAVKTGTTKNFKDNWCIGFTTKYTVGVWVGNFDGSPMNGVSGISGAAPLFRDIMIELHRNEYPEDFDGPKSLRHLKICAKTGLIAGKNCALIEEVFIPGTEPEDTCKYCAGVESDTALDRRLDCFRNNRSGLCILHPQNGDIFKLDPHIPYKNQAIAFKVKCDSTFDSYTLYLNDKKLCENNPNFLWQPNPGQYKLKLYGRVKTITYIDSVIFSVF